MSATREQKNLAPVAVYVRYKKTEYANHDQEFDVVVPQNADYRAFRDAVATAITTDDEFKKEFGVIVKGNRVSLFEYRQDGSRGEVPLKAKDFKSDAEELFALIAKPEEKQDVEEGGGGDQEDDVADVNETTQIFPRAAELAAAVRNAATEEGEEKVASIRAAVDGLLENPFNQTRLKMHQPLSDQVEVLTDFWLNPWLYELPRTLDAKKGALVNAREISMRDDQIEAERVTANGNPSTLRTDIALFNHYGQMVMSFENSNSVNNKTAHTNDDCGKLRRNALRVFSRSVKEEKPLCPIYTLQLGVALEGPIGFKDNLSLEALVYQYEEQDGVYRRYPVFDKITNLREVPIDELTVNMAVFWTLVFDSCPDEATSSTRQQQGEGVSMQEREQKQGGFSPSSLSQQQQPLPPRPEFTPARNRGAKATEKNASQRQLWSRELSFGYETKDHFIAKVNRSQEYGLAELWALTWCSPIPGVVHLVRVEKETCAECPAVPVLVLERLEEFDWAATRQSMPEIQKCFKSLITSLADMHALGVAHLDINPSMVMRRPTSEHANTPILLDFNSAFSTLEKFRGFRAGTGSFTYANDDCPAVYGWQADCVSLGVLLSWCIGVKNMGWKGHIDHAARVNALKTYMHSTSQDALKAGADLAMVLISAVTPLQELLRHPFVQSARTPLTPRGVTSLQRTSPSRKQNMYSFGGQKENRTPASAPIV